MACSIHGGLPRSMSASNAKSSWVKISCARPSASRTASTTKKPSSGMLTHHTISQCTCISCNLAQTNGSRLAAGTQHKSFIRIAGQTFEDERGLGCRLRSYRWTSWLAEPTANSWEVIGFHWTVQTLARTSISARLFCCCDDHTWNTSRLLTNRF